MAAAPKQPSYKRLTRWQRRQVDKAVRHGVPRYHAVCIMAAVSRYRGLGFATGLALFEQETHFANVFGHDPTIFVGAGVVTHAKYAAYKRQRGPTGRGGMQGVGPGQLTWYATQDYADARGGCWKVYVNVDVAVETLAKNIAAFGYAKGIERYNGSGEAAEAYSRRVRLLAARWRRIL